MMEVNEIKSRIFKGGIFRVVALFLRKGLGFVKIIVFARIFTPEQYGTAILLLSLAEFLSWLGGIGLPEFSLKEKNSPGVIQTAFTLSLLLSAVTFLLFCLLSPLFSLLFLDTMAYWSLIVLGGYVIFSVPANFPQVILLGNLSFDKASIPPFLNDFIILVVASILHLVFLLGPLAIILGQLGGFLTSVFLLWRMTEFHLKLKLDKQKIKEMTLFSWPLSLKNLGAVVLRRFEVMSISKFYSAAPMAQFNIANNLVENVKALITAVDGMILPILVTVQGNPTKVRRYFILSCKLYGWIGIPLGTFFFLFAEPLIRLLFGPIWISSVPVLRILGLSLVLRSWIADSFGYLAYLTGRTQFLLVNNLTQTIAKITLGTCFILWWGIEGAAWYNCIFPVIIGFISRAYIIKKTIGAVNLIQRTWHSLAAAGIVAGLVLLLYPDTRSPTLEAMMMGIYLISCYGLLFLIDKDFKYLIINFLIKYRK